MARTLVACLIMIAVLAAHVDATTIADIVAAPESYNGQQVTVTGTVANPSAAYLGDITYNLSADNLRITVFGRGTLPAVGDHVTVDAKVRWREGDEEFTWPPVLLESSHQPAP